MKRDILEEEAEPEGRTSMLTRRSAHTEEDELGEERAARRPRRRRPARQPESEQTPPAGDQPDGDRPAGEGPEDFEHAPDGVENEGMLPTDPRNPRSPRGARSSRRHGRGHGRP